MRLILLLSVIVLAALLCADSTPVQAAPLCSQVTAQEFCYPCESGASGSILWQGTCASGNREWRCTWPCSPTPGPWIPCDCEGTGCDCLLAGTPITLADGGVKPVEAMQVGDRVLGYDETTGALVATEVTAVHRPFLADHYYVINGTLRVTETHPFLLGTAWVNAADLRVGDVVAGDGSGRAVMTIEKVEEPALAYNFQVATGTYLAAGMIVHNKEICEHFMQYPTP